MKITYSAAMSRDGFIARKNGDVSWLEELNIDPNETGLAEFFAEVDGLVMGRATYDFVHAHGSWPYEDKATWVCTSQPLAPLEGANLTVVDSIQQVIEGANQRQCKNLWLIGGGQLASAFLDKGLISQLSLAEMPISLGEGIPLFSGHDLGDLEIKERQEFQKTGFRQIEIKL